MGKKYFKTLASSVLSKFEDGNEYHFHDVDRSWIIDAMLVFAEIYANEREGKESPDESGNCIKPDVSSSVCACEITHENCDCIDTGICGLCNKPISQTDC